MNILNKIEWNFLQSISASGMVLSLFSHGGLKVISKDVAHFERLYLVWCGVFLLGCIFQWLTHKGYIKMSLDEHHHDHDHLHDM